MAAARDAISATWELLDSGHMPEMRSFDVAVVVTNVGKSSTFVAADAVSVTLALSGTRIEDITIRGGDSVETFAQPGGSASADPPALRSSMGRANVVRLRRIYMAAGETQTLATLRVRSASASKLSGVWSVRCPGRFERVMGVDVPVELR